MKIYAMSDIHGCIDEFNNALKLIDLEATNTMLILLGDYIHGGDSIAVLDKVIELQKQYGDQKVVALMGNHEEAEDLWEVGTDPYMFTGKFPPETGEL